MFNPQEVLRQVFQYFSTKDALLSSIRQNPAVLATASNTIQFVYRLLNLITLGDTEKVQALIAILSGLDAKQKMEQLATLQTEELLEIIKQSDHAYQEETNSKRQALIQSLIFAASYLYIQRIHEKYAKDFPGKFGDFVTEITTTLPASPAFSGSCPIEPYENLHQALMSLLASHTDLPEQITKDYYYAQAYRRLCHHLGIGQEARTEYVDKMGEKLPQELFHFRSILEQLILRDKDGLDTQERLLQLEYLEKNPEEKIDLKADPDVKEFAKALYDLRGNHYILFNIDSIPPLSDQTPPRLTDRLMLEVTRRIKKRDIQNMFGIHDSETLDRLCGVDKRSTPIPNTDETKLCLGFTLQNIPSTDHLIMQIDNIRQQIRELETTKEPSRLTSLQEQLEKLQEKLGIRQRIDALESSMLGKKEDKGKTREREKQTLIDEYYYDQIPKSFQKKYNGFSQTSLFNSYIREKQQAFNTLWPTIAGSFTSLVKYRNKYYLIKKEKSKAPTIKNLNELNLIKKFNAEQTGPDDERPIHPQLAIIQKKISSISSQDGYYPVFTREIYDACYTLVDKYPPHRCDINHYHLKQFQQLFFQRLAMPYIKVTSVAGDKKQISITFTPFDPDVLSSLWEKTYQETSDHAWGALNNSEASTIRTIFTRFDDFIRTLQPITLTADYFTELETIIQTSIIESAAFTSPGKAKTKAKPKATQLDPRIQQFLLDRINISRSNARDYIEEMKQFRSNEATQELYQMQDLLTAIKESRTLSTELLPSLNSSEEVTLIQLYGEIQALLAPLADASPKVQSAGIKALETKTEAIRKSYLELQILISTKRNELKTEFAEYEDIQKSIHRFCFLYESTQARNKAGAAIANIITRTKKATTDQALVTTALDTLTTELRDIFIEEHRAIARQEWPKIPQPQATASRGGAGGSASDRDDEQSFELAHIDTLPSPIVDASIADMFTDMARNIITLTYRVHHQQAVINDTEFDNYLRLLQYIKQQIESSAQDFNACYFKCTHAPQRQIQIRYPNGAAALIEFPTDIGLLPFSMFKNAGDPSPMFSYGGTRGIHGPLQELDRYYYGAIPDASEASLSPAERTKRLLTHIRLVNKGQYGSIKEVEDLLSGMNYILKTGFEKLTEVSTYDETLRSNPLLEPIISRDDPLVPYEMLTLTALKKPQDRLAIWQNPISTTRGPLFKKQGTQKYHILEERAPGRSLAEIANLDLARYGKDKPEFHNPLLRRDSQYAKFIPDRCEFAVSVVRAAIAFEKQGFCHNDIKPENFICKLNPDGSYVINFIDWATAGFRRRYTGSAVTAEAIIEEVFAGIDDPAIKGRLFVTREDESGHWYYGINPSLEITHGAYNGTLPYINPQLVDLEGDDPSTNTELNCTDDFSLKYTQQMDNWALITMIFGITRQDSYFKLANIRAKGSNLDNFLIPQVIVYDTSLPKAQIAPGRNFDKFFKLNALEFEDGSRGLAEASMVLSEEPSMVLSEEPSMVMSEAGDDTAAAAAAADSSSQLDESVVSSRSTPPVSATSQRDPSSGLMFIPATQNEGEPLHLYRELQTLAFSAETEAEAELALNIKQLLAQICNYLQPGSTVPTKTELLKLVNTAQSYILEATANLYPEYKDFRNQLEAGNISQLKTMCEHIKRPSEKAHICDLIADQDRTPDLAVTPELIRQLFAHNQFDILDTIFKRLSPLTPEFIAEHQLIHHYLQKNRFDKVQDLIQKLGNDTDLTILFTNNPTGLPWETSALETAIRNISAEQIDWVLRHLNDPPEDTCQAAIYLAASLGNGAAIKQILTKFSQLNTPAQLQQYLDYPQPLISTAQIFMRQPETQALFLEWLGVLEPSSQQPYLDQIIAYYQSAPSNKIAQRMLLLTALDATLGSSIDPMILIKLFSDPPLDKDLIQQHALGIATLLEKFPPLLQIRALLPLVKTLETLPASLDEIETEAETAPSPLKYQLLAVHQHIKKLYLDFQSLLATQAEDLVALSHSRDELDKIIQSSGLQQLMTGLGAFNTQQALSYIYPFCELKRSFELQISRLAAKQEDLAKEKASQHAEEIATLQQQLASLDASQSAAQDHLKAEIATLTEQQAELKAQIAALQAQQQEYLQQLQSEVGQWIVQRDEAYQSLESAHSKFSQFVPPEETPDIEVDSLLSKYSELEQGIAAKESAAREQLQQKLSAARSATVPDEVQELYQQQLMQIEQQYRSQITVAVQQQHLALAAIRTQLDALSLTRVQNQALNARIAALGERFSHLSSALTYAKPEDITAGHEIPQLLEQLRQLQQSISAIQQQTSLITQADTLIQKDGTVIAAEAAAIQTSNTASEITKALTAFTVADIPLAIDVSLTELQHSLGKLGARHQETLAEKSAAQVQDQIQALEQQEKKLLIRDITQLQQQYQATLKIQGEVYAVAFASIQEKRQTLRAVQAEITEKLAALENNIRLVSEPPSASDALIETPLNTFKDFLIKTWKDQMAVLIKQQEHITVLLEDKPVLESGESAVHSLPSIDDSIDALRTHKDRLFQQLQALQQEPQPNTIQIKSATIAAEAIHIQTALTQLGPDYTAASFTAYQSSLQTIAETLQQRQQQVQELTAGQDSILAALQESGTLISSSLDALSPLAKIQALIRTLTAEMADLKEQLSAQAEAFAAKQDDEKQHFVEIEELAAAAAKQDQQILVQLKSQVAIYQQALQEMHKQLEQHASPLVITLKQLQAQVQDNIAPIAKLSEQLEELKQQQHAQAEQIVQRYFGLTTNLPKNMLHLTAALRQEQQQQLEDLKQPVMLLEQHIHALQEQHASQRQYLTELTQHNTADTETRQQLTAAIGAIQKDITATAKIREPLPAITALTKLASDMTGLQQQFSEHQIQAKTQLKPAQQQLEAAQQLLSKPIPASPTSPQPLTQAVESHLELLCGSHTLLQQSESLEMSAITTQIQQLEEALADASLPAAMQLSLRGYLSDLQHLQLTKTLAVRSAAEQISSEVLASVTHQLALSSKDQKIAKLNDKIAAQEAGISEQQQALGAALERNASTKATLISRIKTHQARIKEQQQELNHQYQQQQEQIRRYIPDPATGDTDIPKAVSTIMTLLTEHYQAQLTQQYQHAQAQLKAQQITLPELSPDTGSPTIQQQQLQAELLNHAYQQCFKQLDVIGKPPLPTLTLDLTPLRTLPALLSELSAISAKQLQDILGSDTEKNPTALLAQIGEKLKQLQTENLAQTAAMAELETQQKQLRAQAETLYRENIRSKQAAQEYYGKLLQHIGENIQKLAAKLGQNQACIAALTEQQDQDLAAIKQKMTTITEPESDSELNSIYQSILKHYQAELEHTRDYYAQQLAALTASQQEAQSQLTALQKIFSEKSNGAAAPIHESTEHTAADDSTAITTIYRSATVIQEITTQIYHEISELSDFQAKITAALQALPTITIAGRKPATAELAELFSQMQKQHDRQMQQFEEKIAAAAATHEDILKRVQALIQLISAEHRTSSASDPIAVLQQKIQGLMHESSETRKELTATHATLDTTQAQIQRVQSEICRNIEQILDQYQAAAETIIMKPSGKEDVYKNREVAIQFQHIQRTLLQLVQYHDELRPEAPYNAARLLEILTTHQKQLEQALSTPRVPTVPKRAPPAAPKSKYHLHQISLTRPVVEVQALAQFSSVPISEAEAAEIARDEGKEVYTCSGTAYHFSYADDKAATAVVTTKISDDREKARTVCIAINNIVSKETELHIASPDPMQIHIARLYIEKLKELGLHFDDVQIHYTGTRQDLLTGTELKALNIFSELMRSEPYDRLTDGETSIAWLQEARSLRESRTFHL